MAEFEFDRLVETMASVHEGNARLQSKLAERDRVDEDVVARPWAQHDMLVASIMAIAASSWSLMDPKHSWSIYGEATRVYRNMGHSY
jgi:hypothetical protein